MTISYLTELYFSSQKYKKLTQIGSFLRCIKEAGSQKMALGFFRIIMFKKHGEQLEKAHSV